jgi:hypothetical protein
MSNIQDKDQNKDNRNWYDKLSTEQKILFWIAITGVLCLFGAFIAILLRWNSRNNQRKKISTNLNCPAAAEIWKDVKKIPNTTEACHCYFDYSNNILGCTDNNNIMLERLK